MSRIAVTGYVNVSDELARWVQAEFASRLQRLISPGWSGITCLARGADQLFASAVIRLKGRFEVILPSLDYEQAAIEDSNRQEFRDLLAQADTVQILDNPVSDRQAYLAASLEMLGRCDRLLAVWDGTPSRQLGDTADIVARALASDIPVEILWPPDDHAASRRPREDLREDLREDGGPAPGPTRAWARGRG